MIITSINYSKYGGYDYLLNEFIEPLFLKPNGVRTRYPIGWNGYGRYMPGTLKVTYNGLPCSITEEENGIFYNFAVAPDSNTNYDDYEVTYVARPLDYAFSTGLPEGGYEGEEYFLFPNWNNALGEGDGFWIGKWTASYNNGLPKSQSGLINGFWTNITGKNARTASKSKGRGFGMVTNREWVSIALWTSHHNIHVKGNINGNNANNLDGDYTTLASCGGSSTIDNRYLITGTTFPDTWNHNGKSNGIHHMVGNIWEFIDGLENRNGKIYIFAEDNETYVDSGITVSDNGNGSIIIDISNTNNSILNEGIANVVSTNGYIPSNLDGDYAWFATDQTVFRRGGSLYFGTQCGMWAFSAAEDASYAGWHAGFRLSRKLID